MNFLILLFLLSFSYSTDNLNHSVSVFDDIVQYMQYESQNIFIEKSPSRLYFSNHDDFRFLYDFQQGNSTENINFLLDLADENNDPDLLFLLATLFYFGSNSIGPNASLSMNYLSKASSMGHPLAQVLQLIINEDEKEDAFDNQSFDQLYSNFQLNQKNISNKKTMQFPYLQFYIANKLYYDYQKTKNSEQCLNILKVFGIERSNLHLISNERSNTSCFKIYKMFRHHKNEEALNLIRSLGSEICYYDKKPIDDLYIVSYYISKLDCDLSIEFIRHSLQNHEAIRVIIDKANEKEKNQNLSYSLKLFRILSHFGIDSSIENSIRISKILNAKVPKSIKKMKKLNDQINNEKCISDLSNAFQVRSNLLESLSYLKHSIRLIPQSIFIAMPLRSLIIFMNFFNSEEHFNILDIMRDNIDFTIFCAAIITFAFLVKLRAELFFMTL